MSVSLNLLESVKKHDADTMVEAIEYAVSMFLTEVKTNISLTVCDNEYIEMLNSKYRKIHAPTDVLSFPLLESDEPGKVIYSPMDIEQDTGELMLGDIMISLEKARAQAQEYGHSVKRELCYLSVHSVLHLLGYDHMNEDDKKLMRQKEEEILESLGIER